MLLTLSVPWPVCRKAFLISRSLYLFPVAFPTLPLPTLSRPLPHPQMQYPPSNHRIIQLWSFGHIPTYVNTFKMAISRRVRVSRTLIYEPSLGVYERCSVFFFRSRARPVIEGSAGGVFDISRNSYKCSQHRAFDTALCFCSTYFKAVLLLQKLCLWDWYTYVA
jgi:hypothetical protein